MKKSKYNFFFDTGNGGMLSFNALKNGLAVLDEDVVEKIKTLEAGNNLDVDDTLAQELERGGFICRDDLDEYDLLTIRRHIQQYSKDTLGLTIAPTLDCNLDCLYCFESPCKGTMDDKVIKGVIDFVESYIASGIKKVGVCWYGGEPLLAMDVVEKLSKQLISLCDKHNVSYFADVITNGTLLKRETAEKLKKLKVNQVQITIDGDKETHDTRRPYRGGMGSFEHIFENMKKAVGIIPISLRVNVDVNNKEEVLDFFKQLNREPWCSENFGKKFFIHYGHVRKLTTSCRCGKEEVLKQGDFWAKELELKQYLYDCGYKTDFFPKNGHGCEATSISGYIVGPEGELYKCWNHVGEVDSRIGSVFEPIQLNPLYISTLSESFEKDPQCRECKYLPICMGGCVDIRLKMKRGDVDKKECTGWKYYLEDALRMAYLSKLKESREHVN